MTGTALIQDNISSYWTNRSTLPYEFKTAFTLAEVLISLLIIGIIAAMTLPALYRNYQKTVFTTRLKKSYASITQSFAQMKADNNTDWLFYADAFREINGRCRYDDNVNSTNCKEFYKNFRKYFAVMDIKNAKDIGYKHYYIKEGTKNMYPGKNLILLKDGSIIMNFRFYNTPANNESCKCSCDKIQALGGRMCYPIGNFAIDVNGLKKPNIEGRDIFDFYISEDGRLVPFWGTEGVACYQCNKKTWKDLPDKCGHVGKADAEKYATYGSGCAARIMDNGWVMDY